MKNIQVAKIISTKQIVINAGADDGIREGDEFDIIDKVGSSDVKDPSTGKTLGTLTTSKGRVVVSKVFDKMSIADSPIEPVTGEIFKVRKDLNVDPTQITGGLPKKSGTPIQVGDVLEKLKVHKMENLNKDDVYTSEDIEEMIDNTITCDGKPVDVRYRNIVREALEERLLGKKKEK